MSFMVKINSKLFFCTVAFLSLSSLLIALILQYIFMLEPCHLCMVQRVILVLVVFFSFIGFFHKKKPFVYGGVIFILLILGLVFAVRQIWLTTLPVDELPSCLPPIDYMIHNIPINEVISMILGGSSDCASISWSFLGFTLPELTMFLFIGLLCLTVNFLINLYCEN